MKWVQGGSCRSDDHIWSLYDDDGLHIASIHLYLHAPRNGFRPPPGPEYYISLVDMSSKEDWLDEGEHPAVGRSGITDREEAKAFVERALGLRREPDIKELVQIYLWS